MSSESKTAIIASVIGATVGPIVSEILGVRMRLVRWFYIRTLEKLNAARMEIRQDINSKIRHRLGGPLELDAYPVSLEEAAKRAGISLWWAQRANRWLERIKTYGI